MVPWAHQACVHLCMRVTVGFHGPGTAPRLSGHREVWLPRPQGPLLECGLLSETSLPPAKFGESSVLPGGMSSWGHPLGAELGTLWQWPPKGQALWGSPGTLRGVWLWFLRWQEAVS